MVRKMVCVAVILVLSVGVALADQFGALITKVEGDKVTFYPIEGKEKKARKGEQKTLKAAKDVKVVQYKFNVEGKKFEASGKVEGGLKNKMFTDMPEQGMGAILITDDNNKQIKEIRVFGGRKEKKK